MKSLIKILILLLLLSLYKSGTAPCLQRGVNNSEFKTPGNFTYYASQTQNQQPLATAGAQTRGNVGKSII